MEDSTTLNLEAPASIALKDTQEDEYYTDVQPGGLGKTLKLLKLNPYPGLRPFKTSESNVFFGRKEISCQLISRLANNRFLAVLGASGSGKSSLVRAGLLPGLKTLPGKHGLWKVAICRPGKNLFGNLAVAIGKACIAPSYNNLDIWKSISSSSYGFEEMYHSLNTSGEYNTLIVIDQFEELFRFKKDNGTTGKNDAALFVKMLIDISKIENLNTYVMITMRSEYLGDCVQFPDLVDEINSGQFLVPRLKFKQLRDAIIEPSGFSNTVVEPAFADRLIGEIGDNMDQLPVLQHALRRSYEEAKNHKVDRGGIRVTYTDYDTIGRMENALDIHAKKIFEGFDDNQKKCCQVLFQCITDKASDGRGIRRPLSLGSIYKICLETNITTDDKNKIYDDLVTVIESFRIDNVNFLMPPDNVPLQKNTEIDISHESLMRTWKQLITWLEKEAKDADLLRLLLSRDENEYIVGTRLLSYKEWVTTKRDALTWASIYKPASLANDEYAQKFKAKIVLIEQSIKNEEEEKRLKELARQKELAEQQRQLKEQKTKAKRRLNYIILFLAALALAVTAVIVLKNKNSQLQKAKNDVELKRNELDSTNKELVGKNVTINSQVIALKKNELRLDSTVKQLALSESVLRKNERELKAQNFRIKTYSRLLAEINIQLNARITQLQAQEQQLNASNSSLNTAYRNLDSTTQRAKSLQNLALATKHAEKSLAIPDYDSKRKDIKAQLALVSYKLLQQSGKDETDKLQPQIYAGLYNAIKGYNALDNQLWPVTTYQKNADRLAFAAYSKDEEKQSVIYLTAEDANLYSFNFQTNQKDILYTGINKNFVAIEKSPGGRWIALNTLSKQLLMIDLLKQNNRDTSLSFSGTVRTCKFSPDGLFLYVYTKDDSLHTIELKYIKNRSGYVHTKVPYKLEDLAISSNFIYGVTAHGEVAKWNRKNTSATAPVLITVPDKSNKEKYRGTKIGYNATDDIIVWGNEGGEVFYCKQKSSNTGQNLTRFGGPITDIAFNDAGTYLAVSSYDKSIRVFQLPNLQAEAPIDLHNDEGPVTSVFFQKGKDNLQGESLLAIMSPGLLKRFPMNMAALACKLEQLSTGILSPDDRNLYFDKQAQNKIEDKACKN